MAPRIFSLKNRTDLIKMAAELLLCMRIVVLPPVLGNQLEAKKYPVWKICINLSKWWQFHVRLMKNKV